MPGPAHCPAQPGEESHVPPIPSLLGAFFRSWDEAVRPRSPSIRKVALSQGGVRKPAEGIAHDHVRHAHGTSVPLSLLSAHPGSHAGPVRDTGVERCPNLVGDDLHPFPQCSAYEDLPAASLRRPFRHRVLGLYGTVHALGRDRHQDRTRHMVMDGRYAACEGACSSVQHLGLMLLTIVSSY